MTTGSPVVGVLALQGDYQRHREMLDSIGASSLPVRFADDFERIDRLIIPGGESTVIMDLLRRFELEGAFSRFVRSRPVWGTCAGMIILAARVNDSSISPYGMIDIAVDRNGYGRQVFSTVVPATLSLNGSQDSLDMVFIRAPRVTWVGEGVTTLLRRGDDPVLLCQKNVLVSAFHPELTGSMLLHHYFAYRFPEMPARQTA
jgi:5'-phosphate synthase pdxT subunit